MDQTISGTIHGNTIVLDAPPSVPEGERVEVIVRTSEGVQNPGEGILRSEGARALEFTEEDQRILDEIQRARQDTDSSDNEPPAWWTEEDDRILDEIYRARKRSTRSEVAE